MSKRSLPKFDFADILILTGIALFWFGAYSYLPWAANALTGLMLLAIGIKMQKPATV